jgi:hypothetical protein
LKRPESAGWYRDHAGTGVYTFWNGVFWSARAHESWTAEQAAAQASIPSTVQPVDPQLVSPKVKAPTLAEVVAGMDIPHALAHLGRELEGVQNAETVKRLDALTKRVDVLADRFNELLERLYKAAREDDHPGLYD